MHVAFNSLLSHRGRLHTCNFGGRHHSKSQLLFHQAQCWLKFQVLLTATASVGFCLCSCCSPVRVINVASLAHTFGRINFDDLMSTKSYDAWTAYGE